MFEEWLEGLEARHLANLRVADVTRALRALSSAYVERRRGRGSDLLTPAVVHHALDSAGKRAAFAVFYAPLHFLAADRVVRALGADVPPLSSILDIGCGTGAAGAAWALAAGGTPQRGPHRAHLHPGLRGGVPVTGIDRHRWAVEEARWTYRQLGLRGRARQGDLARLPALGAGSAVIAAYVLNELPDAVRAPVEDQLIDAAGRGVRVLVLEPIARGVTPWWEAAAARIRATGGRADEWRFPVQLPPLLRLLDKAAGLHHQELTARSLYCPDRSAFFLRRSRP